MISLYDFVDECREQGMTAEEAEREYLRAVEEEGERRIEEYENSPETWAGWAQQDTIDMYRRER